MGSLMLHLEPIWYHSEPSNVPYSQNLPRTISWFGLLLQQNDSNLKNKKVLFLQKYFLGRCQYHNKKALFTDSIFQKVLRQAISTDTSFEVKMMVKLYAIEIIFRYLWFMPSLVSVVRDYHQWQKLDSVFPHIRPSLK